MNKIHGLFSISGFMFTMLCFVLTGAEVTKLGLTIIFLVWIAAETVCSGIIKLIRRQILTRRLRFTEFIHSQSNHR